MDTPDFHGRKSELAWLRGLWDACHTEQRPRMAVLVAHALPILSQAEAEAAA